MTVQADEHRRTEWYTQLLAETLRTTDDVDEAVIAANLAFSLQPEPPATFSADAALSEGPHKFSSTQFNLADGGYSRSQGNPAEKIKKLAAAIPDDILADDGREDTPHVTVKYGLHTDDPDDVISVVNDFGPVQIKLGDISIFKRREGKSYDVVKIDVESTDLRRLNRLISKEIECTDTHPTYKPHVTLAYVKAGYGQQFVGPCEVTGQEIILNRLIFSSADGDKKEIAIAKLGEPLSIEAFFAWDIENRKAQGILNKALAAAKKISAVARRNLESALHLPAEQILPAITAFVQRYRMQLANLLGVTNLAALLEGAREVAKNVPAAPPPGTSPPPPAALPPEDTTRLLNELRPLTALERSQRLQSLPGDQQAYLTAVLASEGGSVPPPPFAPPVVGDESIHFPIIDEAARLLAEKNLVTRPQFDALDAAARAKAFTVAGVDAQETLGKIRDALAENVREGADFATFRTKILERVDEGTFLSEAHLETVFRVNISSAFSDGQMLVLSHPVIRGGFPYVVIETIADDRRREEHGALEKYGIQGTNVYRINDPVFQKFRGPWDFGCRCGWRAITIRQAAEMGVQEAIQWLATGIEPRPPAFVKPPPFEPPPGFRRSLGAAPLSIQLSIALAVDAEGHEHKGTGPGGGQFTGKGKGGSKEPKMGEKRKGYTVTGMSPAIQSHTEVDHVRGTRRQVEGRDAIIFYEEHDEHGRPIGGGEMSQEEWDALEERSSPKVSFVVNPKAKKRGYKTVFVDPAKLDEAWAKNESYYLPAGGAGKSEVAGRRETFAKFLQSGKEIETPIVDVSGGSVDFEDGRHRFAVLRDMGVKSIPISVPADQAEDVQRRFGHLEAAMSITETPRKRKRRLRLPRAWCKGKR